MKFIPMCDDKRTPFCKRGNKSYVAHYLIGGQDNTCKECGTTDLTDEDSDHMRISHDHHKTSVILCGKCADEYYRFWLMCELTGV